MHGNPGEIVRILFAILRRLPYITDVFVISHRNDITQTNPDRRRYEARFRKAFLYEVRKAPRSARTHALIPENEARTRIYHLDFRSIRSRDSVFWR